MNEAEKLFERLRDFQEKKGYYFNEDMDLTMGLLEGLLTNKGRLGYFCCPCRLGSGDRTRDSDITCPCDYREADVAEFGSCYCSLYVSKEWNEGKIPHEYVPERRPPEKSGY